MNLVLDPLLEQRNDQVPGTFEQRLEVEARSGVDVFDPDAAWTWTALAQETSHRHAAELYERTGSLGAAVTVADREWAAVSVLGQVARERCAARDVTPSDFTSEDRNLRMAACAARGDLVFEGALLSDAYDLGNHSSNPAHVGRVVHPPAFIDAPEGRVPWDQLGYETQLAYIDGYAAGVEAVAVARSRCAPGQTWSDMTLVDRGINGSPATATGHMPTGADLEADESMRRARRCGALRAVDVERFRDAVAPGRTVGSVRIVDSATVGRELTLLDVHDSDPLRPAEPLGVGPRNQAGRLECRGTCPPGAVFQRVTSEGSTVPWRFGAPVRFGIDAVLAWVKRAQQRRSSSGRVRSIR